MAFYFQLLFRAGHSLVDAIGTTGFGWVVDFFVIPIFAVLVVGYREGRRQLIPYWKQNLKEIALAMAGMWILLFSYHLFYRVPHEILQTAKSIRLPVVHNCIYPPSGWDQMNVLDITREERSRIHILNFQMLSDNREAISANIYFRNIGTVDAEVTIYEASAMSVLPSDRDAQRKLQTNAEVTMRRTIESLQKSGSAAKVFAVTTGPPDIWFTHEPMAKLTESEYSDFTKCKIVVFFSGLLEYSDKNGKHSTSYCISNNGKPQVIFQCGLNREL